MIAPDRILYQKMVGCLFFQFCRRWPQLWTVACNIPPLSTYTIYPSRGRPSQPHHSIIFISIYHWLYIFLKVEHHVNENWLLMMETMSSVSHEMCHHRGAMNENHPSLSPRYAKRSVHIPWSNFARDLWPPSSLTTSTSPLEKASRVFAISRAARQDSSCAPRTSTDWLRGHRVGGWNWWRRGALAEARNHRAELS